MKAVILAAGRGSRLGQLTYKKPKCMTEVDGISLLDWQHSVLKSAGINDIYVVSGYLSNVISKMDYQTLYNSDWNKSNMVMSIKIALDNIEPPFIISYSDIIYSRKIINDLIKSNSDISVAYDKNWLNLWEMRFKDPLVDAESFILNSKSNIIEIGNKVKDVREIEGQFMGLLKINNNGKQSINRIINKKKDNLFTFDTTKLLSGMIKKRITIKAIPNYEGWCEIDSQKDLSIANNLVKNGIINKPQDFKI